MPDRPSLHGCLRRNGLTRIALMPTLSLSLIVKNEEENLERCLSSVRGVADEIVLVDTGSTDRTAEIAQAHGARIFHHPWQNDFAQARNAGLEQAQGDWILIMDADEELEPGSRERLKAVLEGPAPEALLMVVRNFLPPGPGARYDDLLHARLFRNRPTYRYVASVHEQITPSILSAGGKLGATDLMILHYGYMRAAAQDYGSRDQRNLALLEQALALEPENPFLCAKLGLQYCVAGNGVLAEVYLRRVLSLDYHALSVFQFQDVLLALAKIAFDRQDYGAASDCATDCLALLDRGNRAWEALRMLAEVSLLRARQELETLLAASASPGQDEVDPLEAPRLQALRQRLATTRGYLRRLREEAEFNDDGRSYVEDQAARCDKLLSIAGRLMASATLRALLDAGDIGAALQTYAGWLDTELLALVRDNAAAAHRDGKPDLADGLEALAAHIASAAAAQGGQP